jgi:hypothetical protein
MSSKHTPRPWRAFRGEQKRAQREVRHAEGWTIAKVLRAGSDAEADANLRLITAAPELLEIARIVAVGVHIKTDGAVTQRARALLASVDGGES